VPLPTHQRSIHTWIVFFCWLHTYMNWSMEHSINNICIYIKVYQSFSKSEVRSIIFACVEISIDSSQKKKKQNISHSAATWSRRDGLESKNIINAALMMLQYCTTKQFPGTTAVHGPKTQQVSSKLRRKLPCYVVEKIPCPFIMHTRIWSNSSKKPPSR